MVCSDFAVLRKTFLRNYTQEVYTQENKETFMNISTGFIPPIYCKPPQYKNILALKEFQGNIFTLKTKYSDPTGTPDKGNIFTNILYSGAPSNTVKKHIKIDKDKIM